jgi:addiction module RelB/DinJ family antitoxin
MSRIIRSVMLQARVTPQIKLATDHVLERIGLNMTEAIELFLRKLVIEQRIPFDVVAIDNATYTQLVLDWEEQSRTISVRRGEQVFQRSRSKRRPKRE